MRNFLLGPVVRLIPLGLVLLAIQTQVFANHPVGGVRVQLLLSLAAATGAAASAEHGAVCGFILGMLFDLGGGQPLGQSALAYGLAGLVGGYIQSIVDVPRWWMMAVFTGIGAGAGEAATPMIMLLTGRDGWLDARLLKVVPIVAVAALVMSPVLCPLGRWSMRVRKPQWRVRSSEEAA